MSQRGARAWTLRCENRTTWSSRVPGSNRTLCSQTSKTPSGFTVLYAHTDRNSYTIAYLCSYRYICLYAHNVSSVFYIRHHPGVLSSTTFIAINTEAPDGLRRRRGDVYPADTHGITFCFTFFSLFLFPLR